MTDTVEMLAPKVAELFKRYPEFEVTKLDPPDIERGELDEGVLLCIKSNKTGQKYAMYRSSKRDFMDMMSTIRNWLFGFVFARETFHSNNSK